MAKVVFVHPDGRREEHEGSDGQSVMRVATSNLVSGIIGECGGDLSCATCHVFVDAAWAQSVPTKTAAEDDMLAVTAEEPTEFSRLCCQIYCGRETDGIVIHIPRIQR